MYSRKTILLGEITNSQKAFLAPRLPWQLLLVGDLRQEVGGCKEDTRVTGVDQLEAPTHYEKWEVHAGAQADPEGGETRETRQTRQSETGHPRQPLPCLEDIGGRGPGHAGQAWGPSPPNWAQRVDGNTAGCAHCCHRPR